MKRFFIYEKMVIALNENVDEEGTKKHYLAVPEEHIKMGIFVAHAHPELRDEASGQIDAKNAEEAIRLWQEKRADLMI